MLWTIDPSTGLRLLGRNLGRRDYASINVNGSTNAVTGAANCCAIWAFSARYIGWEVRLELKL